MYNVFLERNMKKYFLILGRTKVSISFKKDVLKNYLNYCSYFLKVYKCPHSDYLSCSSKSFNTWDIV